MYTSCTTPPWTRCHQANDQTHLTNRISYSTNDLGDTTAYSYDSKGRVASLYQHVELSNDDFTADDALTFNHIIDYAFDPVAAT